MLSWLHFLSTSGFSTECTHTFGGSIGFPGLIRLSSTSYALLPLCHSLTCSSSRFWFSSSPTLFKYGPLHSNTAVNLAFLLQNNNFHYMQDFVLNTELVTRTSEDVTNWLWRCLCRGSRQDTRIAPTQEPLEQVTVVSQPPDSESYKKKFSTASRNGQIAPAPKEIEANTKASGLQESQASAVENTEKEDSNTNTVLQTSNDGSSINQP